MQMPRSAACAAAIGLLALLPATALAKKAPAVGSYAQRNLVSDQTGKAEIQDPHLVNAWGLAFGPSTPAWVANNGMDDATLYAGATSPSTPVTKFPPPPASPLVVPVDGGAPTGQVFNGSASGFMVEGGVGRFLFSSEAGLITAWHPGMATAKQVAKVNGAIFKGLAIAGNRIYATDFHHGKVAVFDSSWTRIKKHAFRDRRIPKKFAPFGIQAVGNKIVVTYAKQDKKAEDEIDKAHLGFVDVYTTGGRLVQRFARRGQLNAPWGVALAPSGFGAASGDMLIGNFGDGRILVYKPSGHFVGVLGDSSGKALVIDGLWALEFGNGVIGTPNTLLFTAGPDDEQHGLFGALTAM
jgi:uncharacterized protein (TIGR03118 family)